MTRSILFGATVALLGCIPTESGPDGGDAGKPDAGSGILPVTCFSNSKWDAGNRGSEAMTPGYACRACHLGQNFIGQNPTLASIAQSAMFFMGTAYSGFNESDLCFANAVPAGTVVEILDSAGQLKLSLEVGPSGNFRSNSVEAPFPMPYRARIRSNGKVASMGATQTDGDCNTCHTEQGREGAPGRIVWP